MGNCGSTEEDTDTHNWKANTQKSNNIAVLTFAGPNAFVAPLPESQPTFSDPAFFAPSSSNSRILEG